jgi:hypothetical protein
MGGNTRLVGVFDTTILRIARVADVYDLPTYDISVIVNGSNHVVTLSILETGGYVGVAGWGSDEAFPYALNAGAVIGSWARRVHEGESVLLPAQMLI